MLPFVRHGPVALAGLYDDQITAQGVQSSVAAAVDRWITYVAMTGLDFLPWSVLAAVAVAAAPSAVVAALRRERRLVGYALAWWLALVVGLAAMHFTRPRYMAPSYPLLAVPVALVLVAAARQPPGARWLRDILRSAGVVVAGLGMLLAGLGAFVDSRLVLTGIVWIAGGTVAARAGAATEGGASVRGTLLGFAGLGLLLFGTWDG